MKKTLGNANMKRSESKVSQKEKSSKQQILRTMKFLLQIIQWRKTINRS